jgi:transmembrane sensor
MISKHDPVRAVVARQAADWFVANQGALPGQSERAAFFEWLRASPIHVEEYLGVALVARDLPLAADDTTVSLDTLLKEARTDIANGVAPFERGIAAAERSIGRPRRPGRWPIAAAVAATLLVLVGLVWWALDAQFLAIPRSFETAHGEQRSWRLADGSLLRLNTDTAVTVRFSRKERLIELKQGQAHFEVAHDVARRFRVAAGEVGAIATGTQFDVYRKRTTTIVTVSEGEVAVFTGQPPRVGRGDPANRSRRIGAGYQLRIDVELDSAQPLPVDLDQSLAWLQHKIAFEHRPLGEVADEFNRYAHVPLEIADPALRELRISGVFETDDMESCGAFLETLEGVRVERTPQKILVVRPRMAGQGATGPQP